MKSEKQIFRGLVSRRRLHVGLRFYLVPSIPASSACHHKFDRGRTSAERRFTQNLAASCLMIVFLFLCSTASLHAQNFAEVELSRKSVYVQQSFRVTITVYTSTWFTAPLEFSNLQIPNAFIVPFEKSVPGVFTINNKKYSGIQFYYIVFPYKSGSYTVPEFEITAQTPPEGSSQSQKTTIHTKPQPFTVRDVPERLKEQGDWFVAKDVSLHETWNPLLSDLKVGDVVKRTIVIDAKGTLPQFIPDLANKERVDWASSYPQDAVLTDTRDGADANGRISQTVTYLFEKAGDFTFPAITVAYWNPFSNKMFSKATREKTIHIADNPNLGILTTLKDSLAATQKPVTAKAGDKGPLLILGMCWYVFAGVMIVALFALYWLVRLGIRFYRQLHARRQAYLASEEFRFRQFSHSSGDPATFLRSLYRWWDSFNRKPSPSILGSLHADKEDDLTGPVNNFYAGVYGNGKSKENTSDVKKVLGKYREIRQKKITDKDNPGIRDEQETFSC